MKPLSNIEVSINKDHDLQFPTKGTLNWIDYLNFLVIEPWRSWKTNGHVGGMLITYPLCICRVEVIRHHETNRGNARQS
ncbi:hypothetical protein IEQ34_020786 [Dendrobium chrysotoxum]|uniref:Uncharacterized protein n=1 Tax=Dendrobium chrysotoxum TaxID=161865 RepID=A0AAV7G3B1_DENCH|nr:hypothetical protein IEQ34_020786 [Dendrobium chrysotoxum]